jgi:hypothetical protein
MVYDKRSLLVSCIMKSFIKSVLAVLHVGMATTTLRNEKLIEFDQRN